MKALLVLTVVLAVLALFGCASDSSRSASWSGSKLVGKWNDKAEDNYRTEVEFFEDGKGILRMREPAGTVRGELAYSTFWFTWTLKDEELTVVYSGAERDGRQLTMPPFEKSRIKWQDHGGFYMNLWNPKGGFHKTD